MSNRIDKKFQDLERSGKIGFIAYVTGGDPDFETSRDVILALEKGGADIVEIGMPFSDPLADGPVIQDAMTRSLKAGMTVRKFLKLIKEVRTGSEIPIVIFTYLNPVLKYGLEDFAGDAKDAGADGILILDLTPEESAKYRNVMKSAGLKTVYLIAPTSTENRIKLISKISDGFIYCVSRTGVTGSKTESFEEIKGIVSKVRKYSKLPVAVGFGVSDSSQVTMISKIAEAVVVGSAIVKIIGKHKNPVSKIQKFVKGLTS